MSRLLSSISALSWTRLHSHPDIPFSSPLHWPKVFLSLGLLPCFDLIHPVIPSWGKGSSWEVNVTTCMSKKHLPSHLRSVEHKIPSGYNFPWEIWRHLLHIVSGFQHCYWEIQYHSNSWAFVYQSFFSLSLWKLLRSSKYLESSWPSVLVGIDFSSFILLIEVCPLLVFFHKAYGNNTAPSKMLCYSRMTIWVKNYCIYLFIIVVKNT